MSLKKKLALATFALFIMTAVFSVLYICIGYDVFFTLAITLGTFLYHFALRLFVGWIVNAVSKKPYNTDDFWFRQKRFEPALYKQLKVKSWKNKMPTYDPDSFSVKKHSVDEIIQSMCVAELVHEIIIVMGYFSLFFCFFTESPVDNIPVFLITSIIAGGFDLIFVIMQRYNRPRILKLKNHKRN